MYGKEWRRVVREEKGAGKVEEKKKTHDRAWLGRAARAHRGVFKFLHNIRGSAYAPHYLLYVLYLYSDTVYRRCLLTLSFDAIF